MLPSSHTYALVVTMIKSSRTSHPGILQATPTRWLSLYVCSTHDVEKILQATPTRWLSQQTRDGGVTLCFLQATPTRWLSLGSISRTPRRRAFKPHLRVGCHYRADYGHCIRNSFKPHLRVGCHQCRGPSAPTAGAFKPHLRVGCHSRPSSGLGTAHLAFKPHLRVGCHPWLGEGS